MRVALASVLLLLGLLSLWWVKLSLLVLIVGFLAALSMSALPSATPDKRRVLLLIALACVPAVGGFLRFTITEAAPGIVEAGNNEIAKSAMYKLREIRVAQDAMRSYAFIDHDGDGIGSAGTLAQMAGAAPVPATNKVLDNPPLHPRFGKTQPSALGDVSVVENTCFIVYVPTDPELAERRFVAYAWPKVVPAGQALADTVVLFVDEHERLFMAKNTAGFVGTTHVPAFDAAFAAADFGQNPVDGQPTTSGLVFTAWKNKQPLSHLKGDVAR